VLNVGSVGVCRRGQPSDAAAVLRLCNDAQRHHAGDQAENLDRHSRKCYGQIRGYLAGVFTLCRLPNHTLVNLFGLGQILRRQTNA
jgi:hypothetical protein